MLKLNIDVLKECTMIILISSDNLSDVFILPYIKYSRQQKRQHKFNKSQQLLIIKICQKSYAEL